MENKEIRMRCIESAIKLASAQALRDSQSVVDIARDLCEYVINDDRTSAQEDLQPENTPGRAGSKAKRKSSTDNLDILK